MSSAAPHHLGQLDRETVVDVWSSLGGLPRTADRLTTEAAPDVAIRPVPPPSVPPDMWILASVGGAEVSVGVEAASLAWLVSRLEPSFDLQSAPDDVQPLVLEAVFAPWIEVIEDRIGRRIEISAVRPRYGSSPAVPAGIDVEILGTSLTAALRIDPDLARPLGRWAASLPLAQTALDAARLSVSLRIGFTELTLIEAARLQPGAGLLLEHRSADPVLVVSDTLIAQGAWSLSAFQLQADLAAPTGAERNWIMNEDETIQSGAWKGMPGGLSNLPVRLIAEIGRLTLTVAEVSELKAGSLVDFSGSGDAVAIYAGGVHLADGRLVEIDGRSLVRIERLVLA